MEIIALGYLGLSSPNFAAWTTFGPNILALGLAEPGRDGAVRLRMDDRHHRLAIHPGPEEEVAYIGWELADRLAFERALGELDQKGVRYQMATPDELADRYVVNMAWLHDPYGYRHELYYGQQQVSRSFVPGRPTTGFHLGKNGELGIGHCVLAVPEITREGMDFATEVLGFRTYWPLKVAEMYKCNARTHCLLYIPVPGMKGMHHFYIDVNHMDDVGKTYDLCRDENIVVMELGRLMPDDDISFYLRSPSGVDIQYANGGRLTGNDEVWTNPTTMTDTRVWGHKVLIPGLGSAVRPIKPAQEAAAE